MLDQSPLSEPCFHVSVDDVFASLCAADELEDPWAEEPFLRFFDQLHRDFAVPVDWYVFLEGDPGLLRGGQASGLRSLDGLSAELGEALATRPGIRYGPHAHRYELAPHQQTPGEQELTFEAIYSQLERLGVPLAAPYLRLHYFSESFELAEYFRSRGVHTLFVTDKEARAYRLPEPAKEELLDSGVTEYYGMLFRTSHLRIERFHDRGASWDEVREFLDESLSRHGLVSIFTHEIDIGRVEIRDLLTRSVQYLLDQGVAAI